jgi:hypothetical protein
MKEKDKPKWDGRSRPTNDLYKKNYDEIFKKRKEYNEHNRDTSKDPFKGTSIEGKD